MTIDKRLLLICHDRSGSNLIRGMLDQHPDIYMIPSLPIFEIIYFYQAIYGDLNDNDSWDRLLQDVVELFDANHHPLPYSLSFEELKQETAGLPRTLGAAVHQVFEILGKKSGCRIMGLKFGPHLRMIEDFICQTRFEKAVFQYRDPRDVALSLYKAGVDKRKPADFVAYWLEWHRKVRETLSAHSIPTIEHKYEDLLETPTEILNKIWQFLDVEKCNSALDFHKADAQRQAAATSYMWENLAKPLQPDNKNKFISELGPFRTIKLEDELGKTGLSEFGYKKTKLSDFPLRSYFSRPVRHIRSDKDNQFQKKQNEITDRLKHEFLKYKKKNN